MKDIYKAIAIFLILLGAASIVAYIATPTDDLLLETEENQELLALYERDMGAVPMLYEQNKELAAYSDVREENLAELAKEDTGELDLTGLTNSELKLLIDDPENVSCEEIESIPCTKKNLTFANYGECKDKDNGNYKAEYNSCYLEKEEQNETKSFKLEDYLKEDDNGRKTFDIEKFTQELEGKTDE